MYVPAWPIPSLESLRLWQHRPLPFPFNAKRRAFFGLGRGAVHHLCRTLRERSVTPALMPEYHHGVEVQAARAAGLPVVFYRVGRDLAVDLDHVADMCRRHRGGALFVTHYLGWPQPMQQLSAIAAGQRMLLVEDCALALFSRLGNRPLGTWGAAAIFCLYKTLPVPDGGVLATPGIELSAPKSLTAPGVRTTLGRPLELSLAWARSRGGGIAEPLVATKHAVGRLLDRWRRPRSAVGSTSFAATDVRLEMSPLTRRLLTLFDAQRTVALRRSNFARIAAGLEGAGVPAPFRLAAGVCPLFFPVLVHDKAAAAGEFRRRGIEAIEFWNTPDPFAPPQSEDSAFLRAHMLELPVHQGLSRRQVDYVIDRLVELRGLLLDGPRAPRRLSRPESCARATAGAAAARAELGVIAAAAAGDAQP